MRSAITPLILKISLVSIGAYLAVAALGKALHPVSLYSVLEFDGISSHTGKRIATLALILAEAPLGLALMFYPSNRYIRFVTLALFGGFIVQLAALQIFHGPTVCGCVGWFAFLFPELKVLHGLVIDGMICGVLSYSIVKNLSESKKLPDCA